MWRLTLSVSHDHIPADVGYVSDSASADANWLDSLEQTRWLELVQQALRTAARVAEDLVLNHVSVMLIGTEMYEH